TINPVPFQDTFNSRADSFYQLEMNFLSRCASLFLWPACDLNDRLHTFWLRWALRFAYLALTGPKCGLQFPDSPSQNGSLAFQLSSGLLTSLKIGIEFMDSLLILHQFLFMIIELGLEDSPKHPPEHNAQQKRQY